MPVFFYDKYNKTERTTVMYAARKAAINELGGDKNDN